MNLKMLWFLAGATYLFSSSALAKNCTRYIPKDLNGFNDAIFKIYSFEQQNNVVYFPLSTFLALSLAHYGAKETGSKSILNRIQVGDSRSYGCVTNSLKKNSNISIQFRNTMIFKQGIQLKKRFTNTIKQYSINITYMNFENLKNVFKKPKPVTFNSNTSMVLISRTNMDGNWNMPFNTTKSSSGTFFSPNQGNKKIPMMNKYKIQLKYVYSKQLQSEILELPLTNRRFSMIFILPSRNKIIGLRRYNTSTFLNTLSKMKKQFLARVCIPKFNFSTEISLSKLMDKLNMTNIFSTKTFQPLRIKDADQITTIKVNEMGVSLFSELHTVADVQPIHKNSNKILKQTRTQIRHTRPTRRTRRITRRTRRITRHPRLGFPKVPTPRARTTIIKTTPSTFRIRSTRSRRVYNQRTTTTSTTAGNIKKVYLYRTTLQKSRKAMAISENKTQTMSSKITAKPIQNKKKAIRARASPTNNHPHTKKFLAIYPFDFVLFENNLKMVLCGGKFSDVIQIFR